MISLVDLLLINSVFNASAFKLDGSNGLNSNLDREATAKIDTGRLNRNYAIESIHYGLDDVEAQPYAFVIHLGRPVKLSKPIEQRWDVFLSNSNSTVLHIECEHLTGHVIANADFDQAVPCKLDCILD